MRTKMEKYIDLSRGKDLTAIRKHDTHTLILKEFCVYLFFSLILIVNTLLPTPALSAKATIYDTLVQQASHSPTVKAIIVLRDPESHGIASRIRQEHWPAISKKGQRLRELLKVPSVTARFSSREERIAYCADS